MCNHNPSIGVGLYSLNINKYSWIVQGEGTYKPHLNQKIWYQLHFDGTELSEKILKE